MDPRRENELMMTRRQLFGRTAFGLGTLALSSLLRADMPFLYGGEDGEKRFGGLPGLPHFAPKAKRIIYLSMNGGPSQIDLWDYKPKMVEQYNADLPDTVRNGQRITTMTSGQARFPIAPSKYKFEKHENNEDGVWVSELLPHTSKVVKELCVINSMFTEAINHDPAVTFLQTGSQLPGRPSAGAWLSYGLGSMNEDLPTYVVLHSTWSAKRDAQALYARLWGAGFLPSEFQGVEMRGKGDPV
ncbi:MAG TPA: DUF1501 domain-containing protein, partial [Fimbriimonadaceae bacterium]|nr:DUF1501 domain-containing protein [Fimbriimonadaceae bacterium]